MQEENSIHEPNATSLLEAALEYAGYGWPVFPVHGIRNDRCTCRKESCQSPGKHPLTPNGLKDATTDPTTIRSWWTAHPNANIGIRMGNGI